MRKIALPLLLVSLLLISTGCTNPYNPYWFRSLDEMKSYTANKMLYPDELPIDAVFTATYGFNHTSTGAWDYVIDYRCYDSSQTDTLLDEVIGRLTEGYPVVKSIEINATEMENRARGRLVPDMTREKEEYERFAASGAAKWEIYGVSVAYRSSLSADFISRDNLISTADTSSTDDAGNESEYIIYLTMDAYAAFMYYGVLYTVNLKLISHRNETMEEMFIAVDILKGIVSGMIT